MLKIYTAFTEEIDDGKAAAAEILSQLDLSKLGKNSVGIIYCHTDCTEPGGVYETLGGILPFPTVGCTTIGQGTPGVISQMALTLTVLTSDEAEFSYGVSPDAVSAGLEASVKDVFDRVTGGREPALILPFVPFEAINQGISPENFVRALCGLTDAPVFGGVSSSDEFDFSKTYTLCGGSRYPHSLVLLSISGGIKPEFHSLSLTYDNIGSKRMTATKTSGSTIYEIDGIPALDYLKTSGVYDGVNNNALTMTPLVFYMDDGTVLVRSIAAIAENGIVLAANVPENGTFSVGLIHRRGILDSAREVLEEIVKDIGDRGVLFVSCAARLWILGTEFGAEMETIKDVLTSNEYSVAYCNGEIFPELPHGYSRMQNETLIACVL